MQMAAQRLTSVPSSLPGCNDSRLAQPNGNCKSPGTSFRSIDYGTPM